MSEKNNHQETSDKGHRESKFDLLPEFRQPPSFTEWIGASLASRVLWFICALSATLLIAWFMTRPDLAEIKALLGEKTDAKEVLEALENLRKAHFESYRNAFQLVVVSVLVPLFTLLAGYAFGVRQKEEQE